LIISSGKRPHACFGAEAASVFKTARSGHWAKPAAKIAYIISNDARTRGASDLRKKGANTMSAETDDDDFLDVRGASDYARSLGFRIAPKSLNKLRSLGGGPSFRRFGRRVLYRRSTLRAWLMTRLSDDITICREAPCVPLGARTDW
jgi:hypothetical protein